MAKKVRRKTGGASKETCKILNKPRRAFAFAEACLPKQYAAKNGGIITENAKQSTVVAPVWILRKVFGE